MYPWANGGRPHPGLVNMAGKVCGTWLVVQRAPNVNGNARWACKHTCGGERILEGIVLRSHPPRFCDACRPTTPGTVGRNR